MRVLVTVQLEEPNVVRSILTRLWRTTVSIVLALHTRHAATSAAAMAFATFLGLLPLAALVGWALSRLEGAADLRNSIIVTARSLTPGPAGALVEEQFQRLAEGGLAIAPLSIIGFVWMASGGAHTAMSAIQQARNGDSHDWWINRLVAIGTVIVLMFIITITAAALVVLPVALPSATSSSLLVRAAAFLLGVGVSSLAVAAFFRIATYERLKKKERTVWPGALTACTLWVLASWAFSAYVSSFGRYSLFFGSLAAVALLLIWLWLSSFLLLVGSEINLQLDGEREPQLLPTSESRDGTQPPEPPS